MSKIDYVKLEAVRTALEQTIKSSKEIEAVIKLLTAEAVVIDETPVETTAEVESTGQDEGDSTPKKKQQFVVVVSDPDKQIKKDLTGWVLQMDEDEDCRVVVDRIKNAAYNYNASKNGQRYPVSSIGQAIGDVKTKFLKHQGVKIKTKEPVYIVTTDNILPKG